MKHIRNKNDLLAWLEDNAPRKAIANAMIDGKIELLGFFNPVPGSHRAGWIVKIISKRELSWIVVITTHKWGYEYCTYTIKEIKWEHYIGGIIPLFAGDFPDKYRKLKNG